MSKQDKKKGIPPSPSNSRRIEHPSGRVEERPIVYQIRIKGRLSDRWTDWFDGLTITLEEHGDTLLTGALADQAALHGILKKIRDLGIELISVNSIE